MLENTSSLQKVVVTSTAVTGAVLAAPVMADAALGDDTLQPEMNNDDVKKLQDLLREKGHFTYHTSTGYYGEQTKAAVLSFQRKHNLVADGIAGPQTFSVLLTDRSSGNVGISAASPRSESVSLGSSTILRIGDKSKEVNELQRQLQSLGFYHGGLDSHYGRQTAEAVRRFQRSEQLAVDGVAGPQTLAALNGVTSSPEKPAASLKSTTQVNTFKVHSFGDKGNDVSQLQQQLKDLGYYKSDVTGVFGPVTEEAVRKFQRKNNLAVDGLAGPKTLNKLRSHPKKASSSVQAIQEVSSSPSLLRYQSSGSEVKELQNQLRQLGFIKMEATGLYGEVTENAVRKFQRSYGLTADGIAGPATKRTLQEALNGTVASESSKEQAPPSGSKIDVTNLIADASEHIGTPYVWGGTSTSGFDCSGFLQYVFKDNGIELPRTVASIYNAGTSVKSPRVGDIVFFETYQSGPSHAGIYIGSNQFIHAGSSTGVTVSNMNSSYWNERYLGAKRYY